MLATLGVVASDFGVLKNEVLFPRWIVMFAGDDIEHLQPILQRTRELLVRKIESKTPQQVAAKLQQAFEERLEEQIRVKVLARHKMTTRQFWESGRKRLTASVFNQLAARIDTVRISLKFLVCGMDSNRKGHILVVSGTEDAPLSYDKIGFWAIGDGHSSAIASLSFSNLRFPRISGSLSLGECVYQVCAAKFMSESVGTVGKDTFFAVYGPNDGQVRFLSLPDQQRIRDAWTMEGAPRLPEKVAEAIPGMLYSPDDPDIKEKLEQQTQDWKNMVASRPDIFKK